MSHNVCHYYLSYCLNDLNFVTFGWPLWNIRGGYVPLVVNTSRSFPHSQLITGFVTRLTRRVPLVEQELLTFPEHLSSPQVFSGVRVTRSLVLCVCFADRCLSFCSFSFDHCVVCSSSIYTDSDFPFGILKLFFVIWRRKNCLIQSFWKKLFWYLLWQYFLGMCWHCQQWLSQIHMKVVM